MSRRVPARFKQMLVYVGMTLLTMMVLYPVMVVLKKAFEPGRNFALSPSPIPKSFTLDHFENLVTASNSNGDLLFLRYAWNSTLVAVATTIIGLTLACTAAYALSRFRFAGRRMGLATFLAVQMFPGTLLLMPLYVILDKLGLLNELLGLVLVYSTTAIPFCVWTLKGYFDSLPKELEEAARLDGASAFGIFWKIMLPLAKPGIAVTALFSFMTAWNEFILASTFLTDDSAYTLPVLLKSSVGQYSADWGLFAAGAVLTSLPVMALFYFLQGFLVGGLTAGSVKG